jgi:hypothetical protein
MYNEKQRVNGKAKRFLPLNRSDLVYSTYIWYALIQ